MAKPAMPDSIKDITTAWLQQALLAGGNFPVLRTVTVERIGEGLGIASELLRCRLTYRDTAVTQPRSVIIKMHSKDPGVQRLNRLTNLYERECFYYHNIQPRVPLRSPQLLYGDFERDTRRVVLVFEDLSYAEFIDQIDGLDAERSCQAIRTIAKLHGHFWNKTDRLYFPFSSLLTHHKLRVMLQAVYLIHIGNLQDSWRDFFSADSYAVLKVFGKKFVDHFGDVARGPVSLTHGDFRLNNLFYLPDDREFIVIDWQLLRIGSPLYDVAYFLSMSVTPEVRRQVEQQALREYHDIVCSMGARDFSFDDCWLLYRKNIVSCLIILSLICGGAVDTSEGRGDVGVKVAAQRMDAAIADLNIEELLHSLPHSHTYASLLMPVYLLARRVYKRLRGGKRG